MKLSPLFGRVLLERQPEVKKGSIYIPSTSQLRLASLRCVVVSVGPDVNDSTRTDTVINPGDIVIIGKHTGAWLSANGNPTDNPEDALYYIVEDEDILAKVHENE